MILNSIRSDHSLGVNRDQLAMIYEDATQSKFHFLKIAVDEPDFSHNWMGFYCIER